MMRPLRPEDLPVVADIANRAWAPIMQSSRAELGDVLSDVIRPFGDALSKGREVEGQARTDPDRFWVCEEEGRVVGFITFALNHERRLGEILNNAVDPACKLKGIGQQMYQAVLARFRAEGMRAAKVLTGLDDAHAPARRAYQRAGFNRSRQSVTYFMEL